jgi:cation diffusion facilitator CzcD-associated flavoprotein CzcO
VDQKLDLSKDISMATRVMSAEWMPAEERWTIKTDTGVVVSAKYFVTSTGYTAKKYIPDFKGLDKFKGVWHHTAAWPQEGIDMMGKRVGIIGTGASGVQIIQEIGLQVKNLTIFQRTPNQAIAMQQEKLYAYEQNAEKNYYAGIMGGLKDSFGGFRFSRDPRSALEVTKEERLIHYEKLWAKGGFTYWLGNFNDILTNQEANDTTYEFWRDKVRARLRDPRVREKLAPMKAVYCFGTKRPCLEQTFYEVFNQPNVELIDINEEPIVEITEKGVKTAGKEYEMDILVMATGFDSVTGGLTQIDIKGLDGATVKDKWAGGVASYLGRSFKSFFTFPFLRFLAHSVPTHSEFQYNDMLDSIL